MGGCSELSKPDDRIVHVLKSGLVKRGRGELTCLKRNEKILCDLVLDVKA